jgi:hypothetical protein
MTTITLEIPDELAQRLNLIGDQLPALLSYALDVSGMPVAEVMPGSKSSPVWLEAIDFLARTSEPVEIVNFKLSPAAQDRLEELLDLHREGTLMPQERAELDSFLQINHLFILLKARAQQTLAEN